MANLAIVILIIVVISIPLTLFIRDEWRYQEIHRWHRRHLIQSISKFDEPDASNTTLVRQAIKTLKSKAPLRTWHSDDRKGSP